MKIIFERSGGFAGLRLNAAFDTEALPTETADALRRLVEDADFFALPAIIAGNPAAADLYQYVVTVEDDTGSHTVTASEDAASDALRQLIQYLMRLARKR
jgi:hypothetical protein